MVVKCHVCGARFGAPAKYYKYCSDKCRKDAVIARSGPPVDLGEASCVQCGRDFRKRAHNHTLCSDECRALFRYNASGKPERKIATSSTGAAHELIVCADLVLRGWHVFRSVSASCPCDMVAMQNGKTLLVEVKTGTRLASGGIHAGVRSSNVYDLLAIVLHDGTIYYNPSGAEVPPNDA